MTTLRASIERIKGGETSVGDWSKLEEYLALLGYPVDHNAEPGFQRIEPALNRYKAFFGVEEEGFGTETAGILLRFRCAMPDFPDGSGAVACPWCEVQGKKVQFIVTQAPKPEFEGVLDSAAKFWSDAKIVQFTRQSTSASASVSFDWSKGPNRIFSRFGSLIALATLPCGTSGIHRVDFDETEDWATGKEAAKFNLFNVALHEFGHILGLGHSSNRSDIMSPLFSEEEDSRDLTSVTDRTVLVDLFRSCPAPLDADLTPGSGFRAVRPRRHPRHPRSRRNGSAHR